MLKFGNYLFFYYPSILPVPSCFTTLSLLLTKRIVLLSQTVCNIQKLIVPLQPSKGNLIQTYFLMRRYAYLVS